MSNIIKTEIDLNILSLEQIIQLRMILIRNQQWEICSKLRDFESHLIKIEELKLL